MVQLNSPGVPRGQPFTQFVNKGNLATGVGARRDQVRIADINGDGRADYIIVHDDSSADLWMNLPAADGSGLPTYVEFNQIASGVGREGAGVVFADLNADGYADYVYVGPGGSLDLYQNVQTPGGNGRPGWSYQGTVTTGVGGVRNQTTFGDVNHDGKMDYLQVDLTSGETNAWLNTFTENNLTTGMEIEFHDLNVSP
ncbi:MAG: FG-GAP repeat domain-containing protein [Janthinobacterium lividum]